MKIELDEEGHLYRLNGSRVPSVTQMIGALNLVETRWFTEDARRRGQHVHAAVHLWIQDDLKWESVWPPWAGHVRAAIKFLEDARVDPKTLQTEVRVGHEVLGYAGTADVFGVLFGDECVPDWKSGAIGEGTGIQTALYDIANPLPDGRRRRRMGIQLRENGTYRMVNLDRELDPQGLDYRRALTIVDLYKRFLWKRDLKERGERDAA